MFVGELLRDPDGRDGVNTSDVGHQLAKMIMVRSTELVFDDDPPFLAARAALEAHDVGSVRSDRLLGGFERERSADRFREQLKVVRLRQPWCEVRSPFTMPY
jgi:hypothetical protein